MELLRAKLAESIKNAEGVGVWEVDESTVAAHEDTTFASTEKGGQNCFEVAAVELSSRARGGAGGGSDDGSMDGSDLGSEDGEEGGGGKKKKKRKTPRKSRPAPDLQLMNAMSGIESFFPSRIEIKDKEEKDRREWEKFNGGGASNSRTNAPLFRFTAADRGPGDPSYFPMQGKTVVILSGQHEGCKARITGRLTQKNSEQYRLSVLIKGLVKSQTVMGPSSFEVLDDEDAEVKPCSFDAQDRPSWWESRDRKYCLEAFESAPREPLQSDTYIMGDSIDGITANSSFAKGKRGGRSGPPKFIYFKHSPDGPVLHKFLGTLQASRLLDVPRQTLQRCMNTDETAGKKCHIFYGFYVFEPFQPGAEDDDKDDNKPDVKSEATKEEESPAGIAAARVVPSSSPSGTDLLSPKQIAESMAEVARVTGTATLSQLRAQVAAWVRVMHGAGAAGASGVSPEGSGRAGKVVPHAQDGAADGAAPISIMCDCCDNEILLSASGLSEVPEGDWFCEDCVARACGRPPTIISRSEAITGPAPAAAAAAAAAAPGFPSPGAQPVDANGDVVLKPATIVVYAGAYDQAGRRCGAGFMRCEPGVWQGANLPINPAMVYPPQPVVSSLPPGTPAVGWTYSGNWSNDMFHGAGELRTQAGDEYVGNFEAGLASGEGTWTYPDSNVYCGQWSEGLFHGSGKFHWDEGSEYEGDFVAGRQHGQGKLTYNWGGCYDGAWEEGQRSGLGKMVTNNRSEYEGHWARDKFHGEGLLKLADGSVAMGTFANGKLDGEFCLHYDKTSGSKYEGSFKDGRRSGKGRVVYANQSEYVGDYLAGKRHGHGELKSGDNSYVGGWKEDYWHGQGTVKYDNGVKYVGSFVRGVFSGNGEMYFSTDADKKGKGKGKGGDKGKSEGDDANAALAQSPGQPGPVDSAVAVEETAEWYRGRFLNGNRNGNGVCHFRDGSEYNGPWKAGVRHTKPGQTGTMTFNDGTIYTGDFHRGMRHGRGFQKYTDGSKYSGEFSSDTFHGYGELLLKDYDKKKGMVSTTTRKGYFENGQFRHESAPPENLLEDGMTLSGQKRKIVNPKPAVPGEGTGLAGEEEGADGAPKPKKPAAPSQAKLQALALKEQKAAEALALKEQKAAEKLALKAAKAVQKAAGPKPLQYTEDGRLLDEDGYVVDPSLYAGVAGEDEAAGQEGDGDYRPKGSKSRPVKRARGDE